MAKYNHILPFMCPYVRDKNTGNKLKCFMLIIPDRYIPKKEEQQEGKKIIKNVDDVNTLYSEKEESQ